MPDVGLLTPGADLGPGSPAALTDDVAVLRAMLRVEAAWVRVVVGHQADDDADLDAVERLAGADDDGDLDSDLDAVVESLAGADDDALALATRLARAGGAGGNPVIPLVATLREAAGPRLAPAVHAGLTSQDVLDTALPCTALPCTALPCAAVSYVRNTVSSSPSGPPWRRMSNRSDPSGSRDVTSVARRPGSSEASRGSAPNGPGACGSPSSGSPSSGAPASGRYARVCRRSCRPRAKTVTAKNAARPGSVAPGVSVRNQ